MNIFAHTVTDHGDHVRLVLTGDVDFAAHSALADRLTTLVAGGRAVVVDCAGVTFLDSMGLRALVEGLGAARASGVGFEVADPSQPVLRVMELAGTAELFGLGSRIPEQSGA